MALWVFSAMWAGAAGVREGMTRAEVEAELGKPLSVLTRGDKLVMRYPNDGRVELVEGKAVRVVRVRHADDPLTPAEQEAADAERARAAEAGRAEAEARVAKAVEEAEAAEEATGSAHTTGLRQLEESVEWLSAEHDAGATGAMADELGLHQESAKFWTLLGVGGLVQVGVGMVILKLAFAWVDVHADWGQMFWPAAAGMLGGAAVRAIGFSVWGVSEFFRVDHAVSYAAMFFTLLKTTHACTWQRAAGVAAAAKLMSIVVWVFLGVAIAHWLFA